MCVCVCVEGVCDHSATRGRRTSYFLSKCSSHRTLRVLFRMHQISYQQLAVCKRNILIPFWCFPDSLIITAGSLFDSASDLRSWHVSACCRYLAYLIWLLNSGDTFSEKDIEKSPGLITGIALAMRVCTGRCDT